MSDQGTVANEQHHELTGVQLAPHAALKLRFGETILVLPERAIRIGGSGGEILRLCETQTTLPELLDEMRRRYPDQEAVVDSVQAFLDEMIELGGLARIAPVESRPE